MGKRGVKDRGLSKQYVHTSIFVTSSDWDRLHFLADGENKNLSRYVLDIALKGGVPKKYEPKEPRIRRSICLKESERDKLKELADNYNMSVSNYLLGIVL